MEIIKKWPLSTLKQWSINWSNKTQVLKFNDEVIQISLPENDISILHEYIGGHVFLHLRKNSADILDTAMWSKLTSSEN